MPMVNINILWSPGFNVDGDFVVQMENEWNKCLSGKWISSYSWNTTKQIKVLNVKGKNKLSGNRQHI